MKISKVDARDFLSFGDLRLLVRPDLTVVTGPNGAGKSNLGQAVDVVCTLLGSQMGVPDNGRLGLFAQAGRFGSDRFEIALGLELDQPWERDLVVAFLRTAYICSPPTGRSTSRTREDAAARLFDAQSAAFLYSGTLRVRYDARRSAPWSAVWECGEDGAAWCVGLVGPQQGQLFPGTVDEQQPVKQHLSLFGGFEGLESPESAEPDADEAGSDRDEVPAIPAGADQPRGPVDLRARLIGLECAVTLGVGPAQAGNGPWPAPVLALARVLHIDKPDQATYDFTAVMATILRKGILLTNNRRLPLARRFPSDRLHEPQDLRDGSAVAAELFRLRNGERQLRERYSQVQDAFRAMTGRTFDLQASPDPQDASAWLIDIQVIEDGYEVPAAFAGAGIQEALLLSLLLLDEPGRVTVLDEPAVNLEPTIQRRLIRNLSTRGQHIVITHSADLVPVISPTALSAIVRFAPSAGGTRALRLDDTVTPQWDRLMQILGAADVRGLLFAKGVVLCEGATEVGALGHWWNNLGDETLPGPEASNIALIDVGGDTAFGSYISYLEAFGIPWAVIADGPALQPTSNLAKQLRKAKLLATDEPSPGDDFDTCRRAWHAAGVFSFADRFGNGQDKAGEFEAYLERLDAALLAKTQKELNSSKPRVGAVFAAAHPNAPAEVIEVYREIRARM